MAHTRQWYRKEHIPSGLADRDPYDAWVAAGRTTIVDKAHAEVLKRLGKYAAPPLAEGLRKELDGIMAAYARVVGRRGPALSRIVKAGDGLSRGPRPRGIRATRPSSPCPD